MTQFTVRAATALILTSALLVAGCSRSSTPAATAGAGGSNGGTPGTDAGAGGNTFLAIVPPGSNGNSAGGVGAPVSQVPTIQYPQNFRDQLDMYGDLSYAKPGLKADSCNPPKSITEHVKASDQACNYFKPAGITLAAADAVSTRTLTAPDGVSKVTIQRDGWGVPYITGDNRSAAEYGLGFAAAQDRLWLFDVLRRAGRGRASEFLGPSDTTYGLDLEFGPPAGYSEQELTDMVNRTVAKLGPLGPMFLNDTQMFVDGMNAFIAYLQTPQGLKEVPPEYATLALEVPPNFPPRPFTVNDIVANAVLIQSALGGGGGGEANNVNLLQTLDPSIGPNTTSLPQAACELWRDLRHANAADTPHTLDKTFATESPAVIDESCPQTLPAGVAFWDKGSFQSVVYLRHGTAVGAPLINLGALPPPLDALSRLTLSPFAPVTGAGGLVDARPPLRAQPKGTPLYASADPLGSLHRALNKYGLPMTTSNWIGVNASETKSGHPIAVMGPQTGYFNPQLLWEAAVVSKGGTPYELAARGISTVNLPYIVIGHGLDFAWSPTSAESDFTDTRVSKLCNIDGSTPSRADANGDGFPDADGYLYKGQCVKFYERTDEWTATPTPASIALGGPAQPEAVKRFVIRTHYGPVIATATVNGVPVAISTERSTFLSDVDTAAPFALLTTTGKPMTQQRFKQLFNSMTSTFNWLYVDKQDLAYIQSGLYPQRDPAQHPDLPVWGDGRYDWVADRSFDPTPYGGTQPFPPRTTPVVQGDPMDGYFEWSGYLPLSAHIQDTNPAKGYMANWNNSGAPGWWAADSNGTFGPTHRVTMLQQRLAAFKASGRKHDLGTMVEVMADTAYTDLRGFDVLPLILQLMKQGTLTADQNQVIALMQDWMDDGSAAWINQGKGLGSYRRDRDPNGKQYDHRAAVVLMDAWYPHLIDTVLPQMTAIEGKGAPLLTGRYDAPRAQGSAFQEGWFQHMRRLFQAALGTPGHTDYRQLKCAGTGVPADCRKAVLDALALALNDLGGLSNQANWDGSQLANAKGKSGAKVEDYDAVEHTSFSFIPVPPIPWLNRPTFQQAVEIQTDRSGAH
ncbi:MAG: hypothetical protein E6R07_10580 [Nevskiaceae bacterium]|nr:MAG: hypothetical protein E6R07_10580 [Nevskiaceae bacterium]